MAVRQHDLRWIVEASATLSERLGGAFLPGGSGPDSGAAGLCVIAFAVRPPGCCAPTPPAAGPGPRVGRDAPAYRPAAGKTARRLLS